MIQPPLIVPDTNAFIQLAERGLLPVLPKIGQMVIVDAVGMETIGLPQKDFAKDIAWWTSGRSVGMADANILYEKTAMGVFMARQTAIMPQYKMKGAGEMAIRDWLVAQQAHPSPKDIMIVTDDIKAQKMLTLHAQGQRATVLGAYDLLCYAEKSGHIKSASASWLQRVTPKRAYKGIVP